MENGREILISDFGFRSTFKERRVTSIGGATGPSRGPVAPAARELTNVALGRADVEVVTWLRFLIF